MMASPKLAQAFTIGTFKSRRSTTECLRLKPLRATLGSLYSISPFFGHKNCLHRTKVTLGLALWTTNIAIHFTLDFYEAWAIFGAAWATSIAMYLVVFVTASICMAKVTLPWLEDGLLLLHKDGKYPETLRIIKIVLRAAPIFVLCLGCAGGVGQYVCYYIDGATRLNFNNVFPTWVQVILNILRVTSLVHMFCGMSMFLVVPVVVMIVSQLSMKEFKAAMDAKFKRTDSNLSFEKAVALFEDRASFIRQSSKSCSMMLMILIVSSTLSFTLNCYNFLFVRRLAIYLWFGVMPLLWIAIPLAIAAWATETHQTFAGVVLHNWAQVSRRGFHEMPREGVVETNNSTPQENYCITCRRADQWGTGSRGGNVGSQYAKRKFTKNVSRTCRNVIRPLEMNTREIQESAEFHNDPSIKKTSEGSTGKCRDIGIQNGRENVVAEKQKMEQRQETQEAENIDDASRERSYQSTTGRFDYERYIIYLQCLLPDVGFCVGGFLISWDKVFALAVFMASLSAVFTQEVLFGSRKNTLGRL